MIINERLFSIMEEKKIKMSELADALKVSRSVVSSWKNRKTDPPIAYLDSICKYLGVSYHYFLTGIEEDEIVNTNNTDKLKNKVTQDTLLESYYRLDLKHREKILTRIATYLDEHDDEVLIEYGYINEPSVRYSIDALPKRIKAIANIRDIAIEDLLEKCKLDADILSKFDKYNQISAKNLAKIADYLNCSMDYLLERSENYTINKAPNEADMLKMEIESLYNELAEKNKPEARKVAESLYNKSAKRYKKKSE